MLIILFAIVLVLLGAAAIAAAAHGEALTASSETAMLETTEER
jgi:hypothetical protein